MTSTKNPSHLTKACIIVLAWTITTTVGGEMKKSITIISMLESVKLFCSMEFSHGAGMPVIMTHSCVPSSGSTDESSSTHDS